jgi:hypothetical protein
VFGDHRDHRARAFRRLHRTDRARVFLGGDAVVVIVVTVGVSFRGAAACGALHAATAAITALIKILRPRIGQSFAGVVRATEAVVGHYGWHWRARCI